MPDAYLHPRTTLILVIEDDPGHLRTLADILESEGLQLLRCETGQAALVACDQSQVQVAILDLRLRDMDGLQLLDLLLQQSPNLKVIIYPGYTSLDTAIAAVNRGAFAYVEKVGDVEELLAHIHRAFHLNLIGYSEVLENEVQKRTQELVRANDALSHSEQFLQSTLDALSSHIAILDETGTILAVNGAWRRFASNNAWVDGSYGVGTNYLEICDAAHGRHAEEAAEVAQGMRGVMVGQRESFALEYPCHSSEEPRWFVVRVTRFDDGAQRRLVVAHENITERKLAEQALQESEIRYRHLVDDIDAIVWEVDAETWEFRFVSQRAQGILGYAVERWLNEPDFWIEHIHPDDREVAIECCQSATAAGRDHEFEYRFVATDNRIVWLRDMVHVISDADGKPLTLRGIMVDITERKREESNRQRLEAQLRQSQKMETVGTLAGGIAHDFNNVLGAIFIHTEVAKALIPPDNAGQENLRDVLLAAGRAKDLVQQILTFSRQVETPRQPVRLTSVIQDTLTLIRASLPATIEIRHQFPATEGTIFADSTQLHQIVLNLCVNAGHSMRATGGTLDIHVDSIEGDAGLACAYPELEPGDHVRLTIRDSGHGMAPEVVERIFDPFFTTKGVGEGTGMGLAIVHGIVTSYGGAIRVESTPGIGSTFTLYFPCTQASVSEPMSLQDATLPEAAACIMVVDDEAALVSGMKALLIRLGYDVLPYTSSQEALAAFDAQPERFDLVITDQTMPHLTGEQLARELRQRRPDIPIILCTGFSHVMNANKAKEQGIDAFCMKPLNMKELTETIQKVLETD